MQKKVFFPFGILLLGLIIINSSFTMKDKKIRIALSAGSDNYKNYILRSDTTIDIIDMRGMDAETSIQLLHTCDGIIFTGGEDVEPSYYGKAADSARCSINVARDTQEFALINEAFKLELPIFGICRGQQILNVALGGTLIVDIPQDYETELLHRQEDYLKCYHEVNLLQNSLLASICFTEEGSVSSNHHQAVEKLAPGLKATAWASDGIIEAMEWDRPESKPFFIAVQWHPERMNENSLLSMPIMHAFLSAARAYNRKV